MLPGYHNFFRQIAGKVYHKEPDKPALNLTVEDKGEIMSLLPLSYKFHNTGRVKIPNVDDRTFSDIQSDKTSPKINATDFPRDGYIGEGIYFE